MLIFFGMMLVIAACKEKPKNPVAEYGDTLINSIDRSRAAADVANLDALKKALQAYHAAQDKYPADLGELAPLIGGGVDFSKYDYDPQTGTVGLKK